MNNLIEIIEPLKNKKVPTSNEIKIYKNSLHSYEGTHFIMVKYDDSKYIVAVGEGPLFIIYDISGFNNYNNGIYDYQR